MKIVDLKKEHLFNIKLRNLELDDLLGGDALERHADFYLNCQYKKAILVEDQVAVIMGGNINNQSQCNTWLIASDLIETCPISTMKLIKRLHREGAQSHNIKLFYTYNLPSYEREVRFVESVGYKRQGTVNYFEDGKNRILLTMEA
nr:hypothetical protein BHI3_07650 [Bacteriovorax sp. HI3]